MQWSAWKLSARLAWSSWLYRIFTFWTVLCLTFGIGWYLARLAGVDTAQGSFVFHYTVYLGIDDVRPLAWLAIWPLLWLVMSLLGLGFAYGVYRRDRHAGLAWLALVSLSAVPWLLALHYLAAINR